MVNFFLVLQLIVVQLSISGSPRVEGDEDEDEFDDLEHEFDYINERRDPQQIAEAALAARLNIGRGGNVNASGITAPSEMDAALGSEIPLLTYGQEVGSLSILFSLFNRLLPISFKLQILIK